MKLPLKQDIKNPLKVREIVTLGILSGLLIAVQVGLSFLPNIELVSFFVIIFTLVYRRKVIFILSVFILAEGIIYGFGLWWLNYLYIWAVLAIITALLHKMDSAFGWALVSGLFGLFFGALCSIPYFFMGGWQTAFSYWVSGLLFDITHCVGNFVLCLLLYRPVYTLLCRLERTV